MFVCYFHCMFSNLELGGDFRLAELIGDNTNTNEDDEDRVTLDGPGPGPSSPSPSRLRKSLRLGLKTADGGKKKLRVSVTRLESEKGKYGNGKSIKLVTRYAVRCFANYTYICMLCTCMLRFVSMYSYGTATVTHICGFYVFQFPMLFNKGKHHAQIQSKCKILMVFLK
jgi:hypothetical protein